MTIEKVEELRKKFIFPLIVLIFVNIILLITFIFFQYSIYLITIFCIDIIGIALLYPKLNDYHKAYFTYLMLADVQNNLTKFDYNQKVGMPYHKVYNSFAMIDGESFKSSDYVSGYYSDYKYEQAHIIISNANNIYLEDGRNEIFNGEFLFFTLPKKFKANICVYQSNFRSMIKSSVVGKKFKIIDTDSVEFNKKFAVRTDNEKLALEVLHLIIPYIEDIRKKVNGKIMLCIRDNRLYLAIDRCDLPVENPNVFKKCKNIKTPEFINNLTTIIKKIEKEEKYFI